VIDIGLVAGAVLLAHDHVELLCPFTIELAEATVLITRGMVLFVLLPKQRQGQMPVTAQLLVDPLIIGEWGILGRRVGRGREKPGLKDCVVQVIRQGPVQTSDLRPLQVVGNATVGHRAAAGNLADRQPQPIP